MATQKSRSKLLFFACLATVVLFDLFIVRSGSHLAKNFLGSRFLVNYGVSIVVLICGLLLARIVFHKMRKTIFVFSAIFIVVAVAQLNHFAVYQEFITPFGFHFVFKNVALTGEYFSENILIARTVFALGVAAICVLLFVKFVAIPTSLSKTKARVAACASAVVGGVLLAIQTFAWYGVPEFQHFLTAFVTALAESASRTSGVFSVDKPHVPLSNITSAPPSIVYVIGESATRSHFSLYGYERETTPELDAFAAQKKLVAFRNAVSVGHRTMLSVPYMLFGLEGPDSEGRIYKYPSIFNYAKARGLRTGLISAQDMRWYNLDKLVVDETVDVYKSGSSFIPNVTVSIGADDMQVLNEGVVPFLQASTKPFFLVVQMNGSHYPYASHSPSSFKRFLPEQTANSVNAYDNTIVYLDAYLKKLVDEVRRHSPHAWIFYSSDHGQNVEGEKKFNSDFNPNIIHNPLIAFPPESEFDAVAAQQQAPVSQSDIVATILDLFDMKPILPIEGLSLRHAIAPNRLRVSSAFMPTFENEPTGVLVFPNFELWSVHFAKGFLRKPDDSVIEFSQLPTDIRKALKLSPAQP